MCNCVSDINYYNNCRSDYLTATDKVVFGGGITVNDLALIKQNNDLRINITGTSDALIVKDWFLREAFRIDQIKFTDGTLLTADQLESLGYQVSDTATTIYGPPDDGGIPGVPGIPEFPPIPGTDPSGTVNNIINGTAEDNRIYGNSDNEILYGNGGQDTLVGGAGNDTLEGGEGNDTYVVGIGSGRDLIRDYSSDYAMTFDKIIFGEGITPDNLQIFQEGII